MLLDLHHVVFVSMFMHLHLLEKLLLMLTFYNILDFAVLMADARSHLLDCSTSVVVLLQVAQRVVAEAPEVGCRRWSFLLGSRNEL